jgi:hypothetical protein
MTNKQSESQMAGNGISTVMMKVIFEDLAEGHQLPKRLGQEMLSSMVDRITQHCGRETESVSVVLAH